MEFLLYLIFNNPIETNYIVDFVEEIFESETIPEITSEKLDNISTSKISEEIVNESLNTTEKIIPLPEEIVEEVEASLKSKIIQHFHDYENYYRIAGIIITGIGVCLWLSYLVYMDGVEKSEIAYSMIPKKEDLICYQNNPMIFDTILENPPESL